MEQILYGKFWNVRMGMLGIREIMNVGSESFLKMSSAALLRVNLTVVSKMNWSTERTDSDNHYCY